MVISQWSLVYSVVYAWNAFVVKWPPTALLKESPNVNVSELYSTDSDTFQDYSVTKSPPLGGNRGHFEQTTNDQSTKNNTNNPHMKITLIKANMHKHKSKDAMQPLFAAAIAAQTPEHVEVCLYDDRLEDIPFDEPTDLAAISIETFCAKRGYEIAAEYKKRGIKTIAGGFHPSLEPEECLQHTDSVFIGDVEGGWLQVIEDLENGQLKERYSSDQLIKGEDIDFDRTIFGNKNYGPIEMVQWSRGCPHDCDFCSIKAFYSGTPVCRPIDHVMKEIASLKKKTIFFVDDNLYFNKERFKQFMKALIPMKVQWTCQISINITKDKELLALMAQSGCLAVLVGLESFNPNNLKQMNKQWNQSGIDYKEAIGVLNAHGILVYGTFVFGYDYDTADSFKYAVDFAIENKLFLANFNPLYPMPGTSLYARLQQEKRLLFNRWWTDENFYYGKTMFYPKSLSPDELEELCFKAKKEFNSWRSIFSRSVSPLFHHKSFNKTMLYFYINTVNRKSMLRKQGVALGK